MSGNNTTSSGWTRKSSPSSKQGPMKATLPMSSLTRQNSKDLKKCKSNSPILSPNSLWKTRTSPDTTPTRIRSPGAFSCKGKCRTLYSTNIDCHQHYLGSSSCIRRTASLDTIYLMGQWPRDIYHTSLLQVDKSTQTDESDGKKSHKHSDSCLSEDKLEKMIRHRLLQRSAVVLPSSNSRGCMHVTQVEHGSQTNPLPIPSKQKHPMRSSIEGLNQEIERLVLKAMSSLSTEREEEKLVQMTPEGHRAPLADLLRSTRSVNTQTPAYSSSQSSGASSRESGSPLVAGSVSLDNSRPSSDVHIGGCPEGSGDSSPDQESNTGQLGTSPQINRFLAREPPDGCERVSLKFTEDMSGIRARDLSLLDYCPLKPNVTFQLKPSLGSAFLPLQNIAGSLQTLEQQSPTHTASFMSPSASSSTSGILAPGSSNVPSDITSTTVLSGSSPTSS